MENFNEKRHLKNEFIIKKRNLKVFSVNASLSKEKLNQLKITNSDYSNINCKSTDYENCIDKFESISPSLEITIPVDAGRTNQNSPKHHYSNYKSFPNLNLNTKKVLSKLQKILKKCKTNKQLENIKQKRNSFLQPPFTSKNNNKYYNNNNFGYNTTNFFNKNRNNGILKSDDPNKNIKKDLRTKIHNLIKENDHPICDVFMNKNHILNGKILDYYLSDHYLNNLNNYRKNFHYSIDVEPIKRINFYVDLKKINSKSIDNRMDFKQCFSDNEQKLILSEPEFYFQKKDPKYFKNVKIIKNKKLCTRLQEEDKNKYFKNLIKGLEKKIKSETNIFLSKEKKALLNKIIKNKKKILDIYDKCDSTEQIDLYVAKKLNKTNSNSNSIIKKNKNNYKKLILKDENDDDYITNYNKNVEETELLLTENKKIELINKDKQIIENKKIKDIENELIKLNYLTKPKKRIYNLNFSGKSKNKCNNAKFIIKNLGVFGRQSLVEENWKHLVKIEQKRRKQENKLFNINKERRGTVFFGSDNLNPDEKVSKLVNIIGNKIKNQYK